MSIHQAWKGRLIFLPCLLAFLPGVDFALPKQVLAQQANDSATDVWSGVWSAEGTIFTIKLTNSNNVLNIEPLESLGFDWQTHDGVITGNLGTIIIEFQGATATLGIELLSTTTAMVKLNTCLPEYQVTCLLAKGREARFIKLP